MQWSIRGLTEQLRKGPRWGQSWGRARRDEADPAPLLRAQTQQKDPRARLAEKPQGAPTAPGATQKTHKLDGKVTLQGFASGSSTKSSCRVRAYPGPALKEDAPVPPMLGARLGGASTRLSHRTQGFLRREA